MGVAGGACYLWAHVVFLSILEEVNTRVSPQIEAGFFVCFRLARIMRLHREWFPASSKPRKHNLLVVAGGALVMGGFLIATQTDFVARIEPHRVRVEDSR